MKKPALFPPDAPAKAKNDATTTPYSDEYKRTHYVKSDPEALKLTYDANSPVSSGLDNLMAELRKHDRKA